MVNLSNIKFFIKSNSYINSKLYKLFSTIYVISPSKLNLFYILIKSILFIFLIFYIIY